MRIAGLTVARTTHWGCVSRRASLWQAWDLASQRLELAESNVGAAGQVWCQGRTYEERGPLCREPDPAIAPEGTRGRIGGHHTDCWPDRRTDCTLGSASRWASLWQAWHLASQRLGLAESHVGVASQLWCQGRTYEERDPLSREPDPAIAPQGTPGC